jgi:hypothetical protein
MPPKVSDAAPGAAGQPAATQQVALSPEQFEKLVELLTPGYDLAKLFMEQEQARASERAISQQQPNDSAEYGEPGSSAPAPDPAAAAPAKA